ncbi:hypothetical protein [Marinobacter xestospongiae]|uniref:hypothetical protein n=1 Tax=Marinobacter xestospongiae TaxID=994319 RepID=UPI0020042FFF|nr:hypothetical protein [Marinobacter xestospongiae]MCK7569190.1 hypothetical protein [Marinobacter xestospongiae]
MDLDLDKYEIGFFHLGMPFDGDDRIIESLGYSIIIRSGRVFGIRARFSNYYSEGSCFNDALIREQKDLPEPRFITPELILELYGELVDQWDDDVERNYQFIDGNVRVEFSWHQSANGNLILNYVDIEIENLQLC